MLSPRVTLSIVAMAILAPLRVAGANTQGDIVASYERGDFSNTVSLLKPLSDSGDHSAQVLLGVLTLQGKGTAADVGEAERLFALADTQHDGPSTALLGWLYFQSTRLVGPDYMRALSLFHAASSYDSDAETMLAWMYRVGASVQADQREARRWRDLAVSHGRTELGVPPEEDVSHENDYRVLPAGTELSGPLSGIVNAHVIAVYRFQAARNSADVLLEGHKLADVPRGGPLVLIMGAGQRTLTLTSGPFLPFPCKGVATIISTVRTGQYESRAVRANWSQPESPLALCNLFSAHSEGPVPSVIDAGKARIVLIGIPSLDALIFKGHPPELPGAVRRRFIDKYSEVEKQEIEAIRSAGIKEKAEQDERERIARDGDGSPEDKVCQKKGLQPSTLPYVKCRESLVSARDAREKAIEAARAQREAAAERKQREAEQRRSEEQVQKAEEARRQRVAQAEADRVAAEQKLIAPRISIAVAKQKCADLGFTSGTEKFGSCVLQLTK